MDSYYNHFPVTYDWHSVLDGFCGMFIAIVDSDFYQLTVVSDSLPLGSVEGSGHYSSMSRVQISATPNPGYRFAYWNDASTLNPRTVEVYYDTLFTAFFTDEDNYVLSAAPNHPFWGTVTGGGIYARGQTATLLASPSDSSYRFAHWDDGDTNNPRFVQVDSDSLFTAVFVSLASIANAQHLAPSFQLSPNPAHNQLTVTTATNESCPLSILDAGGRIVATSSFSGPSTTLDISHLAPGTYFIKLRFGFGQATKIFVKQ